MHDPTGGDDGDLTDGSDDPPRRRAWRRATGDRYLGGVAAGVARWLEIDPLVVRIGLVIGAVLWPGAAVGYVVLWMVLPSDASGPPLLALVRQPAALREVLAAATLAAAAVLLLPDLRPGGSATLQLGILLVCAGLALLSRRGSELAPPAPASPSVGAAARWTLPSLPSVRSRRDRTRPPAFLTPLVLSLVVLLGGVIAALEWGGVGPVAPGTIVSLCMVLVGGALTISGRWGRARALILLVPPLLAGWMAFSLTDIPRHPGLGERTYTLTAADDIGGTYVLGAGALTVDAGALRLRPGQEVTIAAAVTAGTIEISVPHDAELRVEGELGVGEVEVWDDRNGSWGRQVDTGLGERRHLDRRLVAMQPLCWEVYQRPEDAGLELAPPEDVEVSTTTVSVPPTTTSVPPFKTPSGEPCQPEAPPPSNPPVITIRFEIGAGALEVHRVEALD